MGKKTNSVVAVRRDLIGATVAAIIAGAFAAPASQSARAAEAAASEDLTELVVTGSRITRRDYEANSPLVTVDSAALEQRAGLNVESYLNQLPAYNPAASPNVKGGSGSNSDVQISAVNTVGIASISLRGFGANRSLVLVDGRRATPVNALMVVDVNGIPSSMIKRVEIISGGASATYGADAIGGVSNFLLRRDFEGLEFDTQWGTTEAGDGQEIRASATMGSAFQEGRGNFVLGAEYYDRQASFEKNRDFFTDGWADPTTATNAPNFFGENAYNTTATTPGNSPSANALGAILSGRPAGTGVYAFGTTGNNTLLRFNPDSTIYNSVGDNRNSFKLPVDYYRYSLQNTYDTSRCNSTSLTACAGGPTQIQQLKYLETEGYVNAPQTRYALMATGKYDITEDLTFNTSMRFAQSVTKTILAGSTGGGGWATSIPYNAAVDSPVVPQGTVVNGTAVDYTNAATVAAVLANPGAYANPGFIAHGATGAQHPVPLQLAILLNSRPANTNWCQTGAVGCTPANATTDKNLIGTARVGRDSPWQAETYVLNSFNRRSTTNTAETWQIDASLNYKLPFADWTSELYYSRGESSTYNVADGNRSLARQRALFAAPDYGRNSTLQSNLTNNPSLTNPGFGSVPVPCTSGFYETLFQADARPSDDCIYALNAPLQTRSQNQQDIGELNFQGGLFELPAGQVRAAAGYQFRRNASQFNPDILQSTASFTDQVIGVYPTGYLDAQTRANDIYAELLVPVLQDTFVKKVELEIGGRHSSYDQTESTWTYKINGNVEVNDHVRFRGGYNRATRAPNLGEMFLPLQELFTAGGTFSDPCGLLSNAPFGAGGANGTALPLPSQAGTPSNVASGQTAAGARSTYLICQAQMGATGTNTFYNTQPQAAVGTPAAGGGGALSFVYQTGNANLKSEVADTWTAGVVLTSPFEHALLNNITATVDWYQIAINDAILPYSMDYARFLCYSAAQVNNVTEALARAASPECQAVPRDPVAGTALTTLVSYDNQATVRTSGIDFTMNWRAQMEDMGLARIPGGLGLSVQGTWLDYYKTKQSPNSYDATIDWKGSLGPNLPGFNGGAYSYRLLTSLSYNLPSWNFNLRWRHFPKTDSVARAQENGIIANNAAVTAGAAGSVLSYTPNTSQEVDQYNVFDLSGFWTINDTLTLRFGVDNILDKDPSITTATLGRPYDASKTPTQNRDAINALCTGLPGCAVPTLYSLGNSGQGGTNGGYYDTLGRRYYVGLKARF